MEDTLREINKKFYPRGISVLILILMEDTLRVHQMQDLLTFLYSLNPYSNGRYSESRFACTRCRPIPSLNPYSNGRYSESLAEQTGSVVTRLSLNPYSNGRYSEREERFN